MAKKSTKNERQSRLAKIQAEQKRGERRRNYLIAGVTAVVAVGIIGGTVYGVMTIDGSIDEVQEYDDLTANHVEGLVEYDMAPPVGGDHNAIWQDCGVYAEQPADEHAVHSLEHGAVWITYPPDTEADVVSDIEAKVGSSGYVMVSPYEGQEEPIMLSAWGLQMQADDIGDQRVDDFLARYVQGEQTPEPGAACSQGISATGAEAEAQLNAAGAGR